MTQVNFEDLRNCSGEQVTVHNPSGTMEFVGELFWNDLHSYATISVFGRDAFDRDCSARITIRPDTFQVGWREEGKLSIRVR